MNKFRWTAPATALWVLMMASSAQAVNDAKSVTYWNVQTDFVVPLGAWGCATVTECAVGDGSSQYSALTKFTPSGTGVTDGDKGDITISGSGATYTIDSDVVSFDKMVDASGASKLIGRGSAAGGGTLEEITLGSGLSLSGTVLSAPGTAESTTVSDTSSINLTLSGVDVSGVVLPAGVDHDSLLNFVANEHLDWTADLGATNINAANIPDLSGTYATAAQGALADSAVQDTGNETIAGVKTFSSDPLIPDEAYGVGWNASLEPATKNAIYDKIETIGAGGGAPTNAQYITGASDATLSAERVVTDTPTLDMDTGTAGQLKAHVRYLRAASANSVTTTGGWTPAVNDVVTDRANVTATSGGTLVVALPSADNAVSGSTEPAALEIANASGGAITIDLSAYTLASDQEYPNTIANGSQRTYYIWSDDGGTTWKLDGRDKPSGYPSATVDLANDLCVFGDTNDSGRLKQTACTNISGTGATNLAVGTHDATQLIVTSDTGTDATLPLATAVAGTNKAGLISPAEKDKLTGIEAAADVTDTTNVTAAGALMDSEVDADIKTLSLPASTTVSAFAATLVDDADAATARATLGVVQEYCVAMTAQDGDAAVADNVTVPLYFDSAVTAISARGFVKTAPTGADMIIDIDLGGTSIMSTNKIEIEATEFTSGTADPAPAITTSTITADTAVTFNFNQVGSTVAGAGVVACLTVRQ